MATKAKATTPAATAAPDATKNLAQRLLAIESEMKALQKEGNNTQQHYKFISHEQITNELRPLFVKHGVFILPSIVGHSITPYQTAKGARMNLAVSKLQFTIINTDKPEEKYVVEWIGEGSDSGDKGTNKSVTAAGKYFYMKLFDIAEDLDPDADDSNLGLQAPMQQAPMGAPSWQAAAQSPQPAYAPQPYLPQQQAPAPQQTAPAPAPVAVDDGTPIEVKQKTQLSKLLVDKGFTDPLTRLKIVGSVIGNNSEDFDINTLTKTQAEYAIDYIGKTEHTTILNTMFSN